jgi:alkylated DNA repair dioxygenase AlkB
MKRASHKQKSSSTPRKKQKQSHLDQWVVSDPKTERKAQKKEKEKKAKEEKGEKGGPNVQVEMSGTCKTHRLQRGGGLIRFWPKFLTIAQAEDLFQELNDACSFTQSDVKVWNKVTLPNSVLLNFKIHKTPRLQAWMADDSIDASLYTTSVATPWTESMLALKQNLEVLLDCEFDYCLLNLYRDGKDYIAFHSDNEAIGDDTNVIASVSLGASRRFVLQKILDKTDKKEFRLDSGSLIVMSGTLQKHWKHSIPKMLRVKEPRLNLTFRKADAKLKK